MTDDERQALKAVQGRNGAGSSFSQLVRLSGLHSPRLVRALHDLEGRGYIEPQVWALTEAGKDVAC